MSLILRRFAQMDFDAEVECPYLSWRHPIEPEFSTLVRSSVDYLHTISTQRQFIGESIKYDITSSQMFFTPVPRKEGWMIVIWDMSSPGACVVHIARHFNGEKLKLPLTKHNVLKTKMDALHKSMKLQVNFFGLAHQALWKVLAPPDSPFSTPRKQFVDDVTPLMCVPCYQHLFTGFICLHSTRTTFAFCPYCNHLVIPKT